jgi:integrase/recombinase XerD
MRIGRVGDGKPITLLEDDGTVVPLVSGFLQSLTARGCSPNTVMAYAHDLRRFYLFLRASQLDVEHFTARYSLDFLAYLNGVRRRHVGRAPATPALVTDSLAPSTINRILAAVSTFYEYLILTEAAATEENPLDPGGNSRRPGIPRRPVRRRMRLRRIPYGKIIRNYFHDGSYDSG